jgi:hypothetical protein
VPQRSLTSRDLEVLRDLRSANKQAKQHDHHDGYVRPMDVGGGDGSYHSGVLAKLVRHGLVKRRHYGSNRSYLYRIRKKGRKLLDKERTTDGERIADRAAGEAADR